MSRRGLGNFYETRPLGSFYETRQMGMIAPIVRPMGAIAPIVGPMGGVADEATSLAVDTAIGGGAGALIGYFAAKKKGAVAGALAGAFAATLPRALGTGRAASAAMSAGVPVDGGTWGRLAVFTALAGASVWYLAKRAR